MPFGFLNKLAGQGSAFLNNLQNGKVAEGGMAVAALISTADNNLEDQEIEAVSTYITEEPAFSRFDPDDLAAKFQTYAEKALKQGALGRLSAKSAIKKLSKNEAREAIGVGVAIAHSDGEFEPEEKAMVRELCALHGISPSEFGA